jgi:hypothetical protein
MLETCVRDVYALVGGLYCFSQFNEIKDLELFYPYNGLLKQFSFTRALGVVRG